MIDRKAWIPFDTQPNIVDLLSSSFLAIGDTP